MGDLFQFPNSKVKFRLSDLVWVGNLMDYEPKIASHKPHTCFTVQLKGAPIPLTIETTRQEDRKLVRDDYQVLDLAWAEHCRLTTPPTTTL